MRWSNIFASGSLNGCPCALKCNPFEAALAFVPSVLGNVINAEAGKKAQREANETNLQIARETNQQAKDLFYEQNAFNVDMWNKQNAYNDPSAQVERLLKAGINPAAVFGNGSISQAGSLQSATAPQLQKATVNPYMPDYGIAQAGQFAVNAYMQSQLQNSQRELMAAQSKNLSANTAHTELLNTLDAKSMQDKLSALKSMAKKGGFEAEIARNNMELLQANFQSRVQQMRNEIRAQDDAHELNEKKVRQIELQNKLTDIQIAWAPRMNQAQLNQYYATCKQLTALADLYKSNKMLTDQQAKTEFERTAQEVINTRMKGVDESIKNRTVDAVIESYFIQNDKNWYEGGNAAKEYYNGSGLFGMRQGVDPDNHILSGSRHQDRIEKRKRPHRYF